MSRPVGDPAAKQLVLDSGVWDVLDGVYESTVTIPQYSEVGTWEVCEVILTDAVGNQVWWNTTELDALAFDTEIEVTGAGCDPAGVG